MAGLRGLAGLSGLSAIAGDDGSAPVTTTTTTTTSTTTTTAAPSITSPSSGWRLDDASGNFVNAVAGGLALEVGGVGDALSYSQPGKGNDSIGFPTNTKFADGTSDAGLRASSASLSMCGWFRADEDMTGMTGGQWLLQKGSSIAVAGTYWGLHQTATALVFYIRESSTNAQLSVSRTVDLSAVGTWYFWAARYNHATRTMYLQVDDGAPGSTVMTDGPVDVDSTVMRMRVHSAGSTHYRSCTLCGEYFWKDTYLTDDEIAALYNAGAGRTFNGSVWQ